MKVHELKALLEDADDGDEVMVAFNYGDYWNNTVAQEVVHSGTYTLIPSAYHNNGKFDTSYWKLFEDEAGDAETRTAFVLSAEVLHD